MGRLWTTQCGVGQLCPIRELVTTQLNWFLPAAMIPVLATIATVAETLFGLLLVFG